MQNSMWLGYVGIKYFVDCLQNIFLYSYLDLIYICINYWELKYMKRSTTIVVCSFFYKGQLVVDLNNSVNVSNLILFYRLMYITKLKKSSDAFAIYILTIIWRHLLITIINDILTNSGWYHLLHSIILINFYIFKIKIWVLFIYFFFKDISIRWLIYRNFYLLFSFIHINNLLL